MKIDNVAKEWFSLGTTLTHITQTTIAPACFLYCRATNSWQEDSRAYRPPTLLNGYNWSARALRSEGGIHCQV